MRTLADEIRSPILAFVGPPGVGKTSLGKSIARAMGRKFVRMSLGGIHDEAEIRGHRRTYIGALPGRIIQSIKTAGTNNPVFMLDEVDKIGMDFRGDPSSALLEVLDPEQNNTFQDNYLEVPFDLSQGALRRDRQPARPDPAGPSRPDGDRPAARLHRAGEDRDRQALPRPEADEEPRPQAAKHIEITDEAMTELVRSYTHEAGVRNLEREIANVMRKVARQVAEGRKRKTVIDVEEAGRPARTAALRVRRARGRGPDRLRDRPGRDRGRRRRRRDRGHPDGRPRGLHPHRPAGRGHARVGASRPVVDPRPRRASSGIQREVFEKNTLHIHVPAGGIPKDGPSAGITMATAIVSALTGIPVRKDVAMTGEITLRGRVLPIGGLKSKILAAHLAGAKIVILPRKNEKDLRDIPEEIRKSIKLVLVDYMDQVLEAALRRKPKALVAEPPKVVKGGDPLDPEPDKQPTVRRTQLPADRPAAGRRRGSVRQVSCGESAAGTLDVPAATVDRWPTVWITRTTTRSWACPGPRHRLRSRRRSASSPASTTRTRSPATPPPSASSRRSTRPTRSSAIRPSASSTTSSGRTGRRSAGPERRRAARAARSAARRRVRRRRARAATSATSSGPRGDAGEFSDFFRMFFGERRHRRLDRRRGRPPGAPADRRASASRTSSAGMGIDGDGRAARPAARRPTRAADAGPRGDGRDHPRGGVPRHDPAGRGRRQAARDHDPARRRHRHPDQADRARRPAAATSSSSSSVLPDPTFTRRGADLERELPLTLEEALLGGEVPVATLKGQRPADDPGRAPSPAGRSG